MLNRHHQAGDTRSHAVYSDCERYRYALIRDWGAGPRVTWVMLNPSTATELVNDPTIERCARRSRAMGAGGFAICNLFAFRATRPQDLKRATDPIGPDNLDLLIKWCDWADQVICAWGVHGTFQNQGPHMADTLRARGLTLWHLGLTQGGYPRHPLYVPYAQTPERWDRS